MASVKALIAEVRKMSKSMVIDADGLHLVTLDPSIVEGYRDAIRTERETSDQVFLAISVWWVAFVGLVYAMKSRQLRQWYLSCLTTATHQE